MTIGEEVSLLSVQRVQYLSVPCHLSDIAHGQEPGIPQFDTLFPL